MPTVVIIPVKSFRMGKLRLSDAIGPDQRSTLGRALAAHVAETVESAALLPLIVTADADVAGWAMSAGFPSIPDPDEGLDAAAASGVEWAAHSQSRWIVLHADLPLLGVGEIEVLEQACDEGRDVIAPSADGGTSAISSIRPIDFAFGPGSFHRHLPRLHMPAVVARTGLLHDVDSPADIRSALGHPRGRWIGQAVG